MHRFYRGITLIYTKEPWVINNRQEKQTFPASCEQPLIKFLVPESSKKCHMLFGVMVKNKIVYNMQICIYFQLSCLQILSEK